MIRTTLIESAPPLPEPRPAAPAPVHFGDLLVFQRVIRRFGEFLAARSGAAWEVAEVGSIDGLDASTLEDFAAAHQPPAGRTPFDLEGCAAATSRFDYCQTHRALHPEDVVYCFPEAACMTVELLDADGTFQRWFFAAAPDRERLLALACRLDAFCVERKRGGGRIQIDDEDPIPLDPALDWDHVVLPAALKRDIRWNVEMFLRGRELYQELRLPYRRGFLLVGPPGNGKTLLCRIIAVRTGLPALAVIGVKGTDQRWQIEQHFERAARLAPCILIFEDLDHLVGEPAEMAAFLNQLDGFPRRDGLLVLATTNHPDAIDPALLSRPSRFDRVWRIDDPDLAGRTEYLARLFAGHLARRQVAALAAATEGFSGAFLQELYVSAAQEALRTRRRTNPGRPPRISAAAAARAVELLRSQLAGAARDFAPTRQFGFARRVEEA